MILHHYPTSPFAEKIRLILDFKQLAWQAVIVPMVMPKPDVVALTGGYRKTPFLQIGADIYCDTALIADVIERIQPSPTLYPEGQQGMARILAQWADEKLFWAAMAYNFSPAGAAQMFGGGPPEQWGPIAKAFGEDRAKMRVAVSRLPAADAAAAYKSYLRRLSNMLEGQAFLLGATPCIADFAAYHSLWFTRHCTTSMAGILNTTPLVLAWMDRIAPYSQSGAQQILSAQDAIAIAHAAEPAVLAPMVFQDEHGIALGSQVSIASDSFGPEPAVGELLAATRTRYILRRTDPRAGTVHVHFPRLGYVLQKFG